MKKISYFFFILLIVACSKDPQDDLTVKVNVTGLKKGVLYLKKVKNNNLITVDTVAINGNSSVELHGPLESPEVFYLFLDKNSSENDRIIFFADKGVTEIETSLKNFGYDAKIKGSAQQKVFEEYKLMMSRFNEQNLDLIKENMEALKSGDTMKINNVQKKSDNLLKRRYLFTVNFALNNKTSEVAPYLALNEIYNANIKLLDTINNSLAAHVKTSKYGKDLQQFIDAIKKNEK